MKATHQRNPETRRRPASAINATRNRSWRTVVIALALIAPVSAVRAAPVGARTVSEPETVFYGKVVDRAGAADALLTAGTLSWTVRKSDGSPVVLTAALAPLNGGMFSYSLRMPHQALSFGLTTSAAVVPLGPTETKQSHLQITVDGHPATILTPGSSSFDVEQAKRAAVYRLDLAVGYPLPDSDGDGMPDWWEDEHGLDKQSAADASADADGDGRSNMQEFLAGTDPKTSNRAPELLTREVVVDAGSTSVILIEAADVDTPASDLIFTLTSLPEGGALLLRNATADTAHPDAPLVAGAILTQADVFKGRLVFVHEPGGKPTSFTVRVADRDASHPAAEGEIEILLYEPDADATPSGALEALRLQACRAGSAQEAIVADLSATGGSHQLAAPSAGLTAASYASTYQPAFGDDRTHFIMGGPRVDVLSGGMAADRIIGGPGDDILTGGGGADVFILATDGDGNDTITDFQPVEADVIDLSRVLDGSSKLLTDYARITRDGADAVLGIKTDGSGGTYNDLVIRLTGSTLTGPDLALLYEAGSLLTGTVGLPPRVSIGATLAAASENGPTPGEFTISRTGPTDEPLTVAVQLSGPAANGVDYEWVPAAATIPAGSRSVAVSIKPYADAIVELDEVVQVSLVAGAGYQPGLTTTAQLTIEDSKPEVSVEVLEGVAVRNGLSPATLLISRTGVLDRSVLVRLAISGTATNGVDYQRLNSFVNFSVGQTTEFIQVVPLAGASLQGGAESVVIAINGNSAYRIGPHASERVVIVPDELRLADWRQAHDPGGSGDLWAFASADPGRFGVPNLLRYAFGLDATDPFHAAGTAWPRAEIHDGHLAIRFRRLPAATDLRYQVEASADMRLWHDGTGEVEDISLLDPSADLMTAVYRSVRPVSESAVRFLRVRVIQVQP